MVAIYLWDHGSDIFSDISQEMASYERYFCDEKQEHNVCNIITLHMSVINCDKVKNPNKNSTWIRIVWHTIEKERYETRNRLWENWSTKSVVKWEGVISIFIYL